MFSILACQLIFTAIACYVPFLNASVQVFFLENRKIAFIVGVCGFVSSCMMCCYQHLAKTIPYNYLLLILFTIAQAYAASQIASEFTPEVVISAMFMTASMLIGVACYALFTEKDFTKGRGLKFSFAISFTTYLIVGYKWGYSLGIFFCLIGVLFASIYLISDIQSIVGGKREEIGPDDYVMGAILLYLDILTIFVAALSICGSCKN